MRIRRRIGNNGGNAAALRRHGLLGLALVACLMLAVSEFTDLYSIHVITVTVKAATVGSHSKTN